MSFLTNNSVSHEDYSMIQFCPISKTATIQVNDADLVEGVSMLIARKN